MPNERDITFDYSTGTLPLLISIPHCGTDLAPGMDQRLTDAALALPDTDWHVPTLYAFAKTMGAYMLSARFSRYVIDLNRPPDGQSLYPGQATTDLCPLTLFDGKPLYRPGQTPSSDEIAERRTLYWQPYHQRLQATLEEIKAKHGYALLYDAHSICSQVPRLFEGRLPDLNLGTAKGASVSSGLGEALLGIACTDPHYKAVLNGRFVGGYITRHYGHPNRNQQAVQMELAQATYMEETAPFRYDAAKAARLIPVLKQVITQYLDR